MKKLLAILTVLAIVFSLSVPAMAVKSPTAPTYYTVTYYGVDGIADGSTQKVKKDDSISFNAKSGSDPFVLWNITGNYETQDGDLNESSMKISVKSDLIVKAIYQSDATSNDPNGNGGYDVSIIDGIGNNPDGDNTAQWIGGHAFISYDAVENRVEATADPSKGSFDSWSIYVVTYTADGEPVYTAAVVGEDYDIVVDGVIINPDDYTEEELAELLAKKTIRIVPHADIAIVGNYNGKKTSPGSTKDEDSGKTTPTDTSKTTPTETTSPKSFDFTPYILLIAVLSLGGIAFTTKKALQK